MPKTKYLVLFDQIISSGTTFLVTILLARVLVPQEFGIFSVVFIFMLLALDIFRSFVIAPMMNKPNGLVARKLLAAGYVMSAIVLFFITLLSVISIPLFCQFVSCKMLDIQALPIVIFIAGKLLHEFLRGYFFTFYKYKNALILDSVFLILIASVIIISDITTSNMALTLIGQLQLGLFFVASLLLKVLPSYKSYKKVSSYNIGFGKWLGLSSILKWLNGNFIILVAVSFLGSIAAGAIRVINTILAPIGICFQALENTVPVRAAELAKHDPAQAKNYAIKVGLLTSGLVVLAVCFLSLFAKTILEIFGSDYVQYSYLIPLVGIAYVVAAFSNQLVSCLRAIGQSKAIFKAYLVNAIASLLLAFPLVNIFGILGYAIGVILFQIILAGYSYLHLNKEVRNA